MAILGFIILITISILQLINILNTKKAYKFALKPVTTIQVAKINQLRISFIPESTISLISSKFNISFN